jgi:serine/threonine protein kinase
MGDVYAARDPMLRRPVAVKLLHATSADGEDPRPLRKARAMARVAHPNVVTVYDAGRFGSRVFIAMELVRGPSLRRYLELHPDAPFQDVLALYVDAGRGLAAAHVARVVHRDFKPESSRSGSPCLTIPPIRRQARRGSTTRPGCGSAS